MTPIVAQAADGASGVLPFREVAIALVALLATLVSTGWLMLGIRRGYWIKRPPAMDRLGDVPGLKILIGYIGPGRLRYMSSALSAGPRSLHSPMSKL